MKRMGSRSSIKKRLTIWLASFSVVVWLIAIAGTLFIASKFVQTTIDDDLRDVVHDLAGHLTNGRGNSTLRISDDALGIILDRSPEILYYRITGRDGRLIAGSSEELVAPELFERWSISSSELHSVPMRLIRHRFSPQKFGEPVLISVAQTFRRQHAIVIQIARRLLPFSIMALAASFVGVVILINRGFRTLEGVSSSLAERSVSELTPLEFTNVPVEIEPLVEAMNSLLSSLRAEHVRRAAFVANAAHQLRTPLAGLKMQIELLLRDRRGGDRAGLESIHSGARRLTRVVKQLLALARVEHGGIPQHGSELLDLSRIGREVASELAVHATSPELRLEVNIGEGPILTRGTEGSVRELMTNLIENALSYTPTPGEILVGVERRGSSARFSVRDSGPGIPPSERGKVFERFYRVPGIRAEGTGLGLAIVKEIAVQHQAEIRIDYASHQSGTLIEIDFPLA